MKQNYFVIENNDGDTTVRVYTKEELLDELNENVSNKPSLSEIPENCDTNYWGEHRLIIKGQMVVPKKVSVVTEYNID